MLQLTHQGTPAARDGGAMPRLYSMTWVGSTKRWMRMYRGKRYVVSCRQLNAPPTKEGSAAAANAWWENKKREIDGSLLPAVDPVVEKVIRLLQRPDGAATLVEEAELGLTSANIL